MSNALVISVRLHEGWYHGAGSTPSPARLFQSLIAGRGLSGPISDESIEALEWLERQSPPIMAAPVTLGGQPVTNFVPNNDLDAKQGDHRRIGEIRTKKSTRPLLFDCEIPFVFCWHLNEQSSLDDAHVEQICALADGVFQLGRGVDTAWAWAELLSTDELDERLHSHRGPVLRPSSGSGSTECPTSGTVASLIQRHADMSNRYAMTADGKGQTFRRRAKPKWRLVSYDNSVTRLSFDLTDRQTSNLAVWPATEVIELVKTIRDAAVERLIKTLPDQQAEIGQALIGRTSSGENAGPIKARARIIALPSIGHEHADQQIRRVVIEIPGYCPLLADDVAWAFSGQMLSRYGRTIDLIRSQPNRQLEHYGVNVGGSRMWQTVTPIALSGAARRRLEPDHRKRVAHDKKGTAERRFEQENAASALRQALRHASVLARLTRLRLQKEPFTARGQRADDFAAGDRFSKHTLWHAQLEFEKPVSGPLLLGDGRFLGLGLLQPTATSSGVLAFTIESGLSSKPDPVRLSRSLRNAVMARVRDVCKTSDLPAYFSGHLKTGDPADSSRQPHLTYTFDPVRSRLLVLQPEMLDASIGRSNRHSKTLELALAQFAHLRAGRDGNLRLYPTGIDLASDPLFCRSPVWESLTPYSVNRHGKKTTAGNLIKRDVLAECSRRGIPQPTIAIKNWTAVSGSGLQCMLRLEFKQAIAGPIILGKTRHHGGGVFTANRVSD
ncbi:type I-G CRISPR-associated protein Csb2 [Allorhodopirellula solitaria]|uniref:CRISPR-associated protein n=1 Tax=Allorhodopirellula solitaria TaxID=2527987 RepID=A0A5C5XR25_9BACT|nr:type I-U CRISPR-associated protein Csb2 [Allorhodopirellula solitaria]TWT65089.1 CRISPR-associated protein [Allorhodopirellula solitaria]